MHFFRWFSLKEQNSIFSFTNVFDGHHDSWSRTARSPEWPIQKMIYIDWWIILQFQSPWNRLGPRCSSFQFSAIPFWVVARCCVAQTRFGFQCARGFFAIIWYVQRNVDGFSICLHILCAISWISEFKPWPQARTRISHENPHGIRSTKRRSYGLESHRNFFISMYVRPN